MGNETIQVKVSGLDQLQARLLKLSNQDAKAAMKKALRDGALIFQTAMVANAPKDTGFLAKHFNTRLSIKSSELQGSAFVGPQGHVDYPLPGGAYNQKINKKGRKYKSGRIPVVTVARFLEFGTHKLEARPFITQTFEGYKERVLSVVIATLREVLGIT
jgi:HK97 gp10 family phage protein